MIYEHQEAAEEGLEAACRCQQQAWKPELLSNRQPERFSYELDTKHEEEAMNAKHAIQVECDEGRAIFAWLCHMMRK